MDEYKKYLASQILSGENIVTYRSLSRAMKTHVNTAKGMLFEFHRSQNVMRPGSIHATYLIYGIQKVDNVQGDGDVEMTSSPPDIEPASDEVVTHTLTLVPGERLKETLATYEEVSSFHIFSLARHPSREPQMLADVSQQVREKSNDDGAATAETYGTITNPNVRKRDRKGKPVSAPATVAPAAKPIKKEPTASATSAAKPAAPETKSSETGQQESKSTPAKETPSSAASGKKGAAPPSLKKSGSSGIMSSFAKAAAKASSKTKETPKKAASEIKDSTALSDDGEDDGEDIPAAVKPSSDSGRKSRKEREAELKRMMEESEDEEPEDKLEEQEDEPMEEAPEPEPGAKPEPEPAEVVSSSGDGRRRGKRRVMKKKQIMDDQGYLVTIQEPGWEEFSEDEAPPPEPKSKPSSAPSSGSQASKPKKAAPKGQGNIMSFFSKK